MADAKSLAAEIKAAALHMVGEAADEREWKFDVAKTAFESLVNQLAALVTESADARDAARYRLLRSIDLWPSPDFEYQAGLCVDLWDDDGCGHQVTGDALDAAVDAALQASAARGEDDHG